MYFSTSTQVSGPVYMLTRLNEFSNNFLARFPQVYTIYIYRGNDDDDDVCFK